MTREEFDVYIIQYYKRLLKVAKRYVRDSQDTQDILHAAIIHILETDAFEGADFLIKPYIKRTSRQLRTQQYREVPNNETFDLIQDNDRLESIEVQMIITGLKRHLTPNEIAIFEGRKGDQSYRTYFRKRANLVIKCRRLLGQQLAIQG